MVGKGHGSIKGSGDQTAKRLVVLRSLPHAAGNERQRNYLKMGGLISPR